MCIPYGALLLAGGLVAKLLGWGQPAVVMAVIGALQVGLSNLSLKAWRANKSAAPYTLLEAGLAGWLAYYSYRAVQQGVSSLVMGTLLGLSAAMALFLVYNVAAGGNPPRRGTHAAAAAVAEPAA
ncbi:FATTY ACID EXPORT chloroplastic-like [Chlorella sorokiniana]|uniref:FATTY ACID EXPORT chloroplastic-like n=1 Tax=Chlorella sorokiniana TaxID=3076 RepID=A0A2P6TCV0_CHLSO|nr:FATTY ACID EXPORT chloroplastic-like [Chlorella sorokiniana]|eukprot:PRW20473.1 FATTY ACID EXPORT chloroplastic-like [Chlorella sorokiniana]